MAKILITGMSGTGKSAALQMLGQRGHRVVDTDTDTDTDRWGYWTTRPDGSPDWIRREDAIASLPVDQHPPLPTLLGRLPGRLPSGRRRHLHSQRPHQR